MDVRYEDALSSLRRTPTAIHSYFDGLTGAWSEGNEGPGTWNPLETLTHLVHVEPSWIGRMEFIAEHADAEPFPLVDRAGHMDVIGQQSVEWLLDRFDDLRQDALARLALLEFDPDRPGLHGELGQVTMGQLLASWTTHDLNHLGQIVKTMAKQYREAVGPWRQFLAIVDAD